VRPDFDTYAMRMAYVIAQRATCPRRHVGAVLMDSEHRIVATGYNGAPRKEDSCDEVGCLIVDGHCHRTLHAESNCLDYAGRFAQRCTLFCTVTPCWDCSKRLINTGITRVVYDEHYESRYGKSMDVPDFLRAAGVEVDRFEPERMRRFKEGLAWIDSPDSVVTPPSGVPIVSPEACDVHRFTGGKCVMCGLRDSQ
jgi:dCMP deaminase